jgi:ketosteroid isomerase-like protein
MVQLLDLYINSRVFGDSAYDRGTLTMTRKPKAGTGQTTTVHVSYVSLLEKQPNGDWKLARVIFNYNERPPASLFQTE